MSVLDGFFGSRHRRFWVAFAGGIAAYAAATPLPHDLRALVGGDVFFFVYLALVVHLARALTPDVLRKHAAVADEGAFMIFLVTTFAITISLLSIFSLINRAGSDERWLALAAIVSVPLGWVATHTVASLHYAHLFYARDAAGEDVGGIDFPGTPEPGISDFLYFGFVLGMTAQVADTDITSAALRRVVLIHAVAAFFYNAVLIALAVNVSSSLAG